MRWPTLLNRWTTLSDLYILFLSPYWRIHMGLVWELECHFDEFTFNLVYFLLHVLYLSFKALAYLAVAVELLLSLFIVFDCHQRPRELGVFVAFFSDLVNLES